MLEHQSNSSATTQTKLQVGLFVAQQPLADSIAKLVNSDCYELNCFDSIEDTINFALKYPAKIDCLVLSVSDYLKSELKRLRQAEILLPTVIIEAEPIKSASENRNLSSGLIDLKINEIYHQAEIRLYPIQLKEINTYVQLAINKFVGLVTEQKSDRSETSEIQQNKKSLVVQQKCLSSKLKQRLSYRGFLSQRNPNSFRLNLSPEQQEELDREIRQSYRQILLIYFDEGAPVERLVDEFVDRVFFADISTSQIIEIHMDLIDNFAYQLKIEGRSDDILLDYRLPLIDIVSHLCEMYRRSISESNPSINLLFAVE